MIRRALWLLALVALLVTARAAAWPDQRCFHTSECSLHELCLADPDANDATQSGHCVRARELR